MNSALQLNVEQALVSYIDSLNITGLNTSKIFAAHAKNKIAPDTRGIYLGIIADPPAWEDGVTFAAVRVTFELATGGIDDHARAPQLAIDHQARVAAIIQLFSDQTFAATKAAINASGNVDGLQFIGWETEKPGTDGTSEDGIQLITKLPYFFDVFLTT